MNTEWNTPPNGDFASYVERLSAQSAVARRTSQADGQHSLEGEPTHAAAAGRAGYADDGAYETGNGRSARNNAQPGSTAKAPWSRIRQGLPVVRPLKPITPGSSPLPFKIARVVAVAWLLGLIALIGAGASVGLVIALVFGGIWAAKGLRNWALPQGYTSWSAWLRSQTANK